jgi:hypothetical protein
MRTEAPASTGASCYRQNKNRRMMIGIGTPSSQNRPAFPRPMNDLLSLALGQKCRSSPPGSMISMARRIFWLVCNRGDEPFVVNQPALSDRMVGQAGRRRAHHVVTRKPQPVRNAHLEHLRGARRDLLFDLAANGAIGNIEIVARLQVDPELLRPRQSHPPPTVNADLLR